MWNHEVGIKSLAFTDLQKQNVLFELQETGSEKGEENVRGHLPLLITDLKT